MPNTFIHPTTEEFQQCGTPNKRKTISVLTLTSNMDPGPITILQSLTQLCCHVECTWISSQALTQRVWVLNHIYTFNNSKTSGTQEFKKKTTNNFNNIMALEVPQWIAVYW